MTVSTKSTHRTLASLKLPTKAAGLTAYAQQIVTAMTGNPAFPSPAPTLASLTAATTEFQAAESATLTRTKGAAATRNEKRTALVQLLEQLRSYVQTQADASVENGPSIVLGAGMAVRKTPVHEPRVFAATSGAVSGSVKLVAPAAARRASYGWGYSVDAGKTWVALPGTLQAKTSVSGLQSATTVQFRYQSITKEGEGNWSPAFSLLVT